MCLQDKANTFLRTFHFRDFSNNDFIGNVKILHELSETKRVKQLKVLSKSQSKTAKTSQLLKSLE